MEQRRLADGRRTFIEIITLGTCQSYEVCQDGSPAGADMDCTKRRELRLPALLTLSGEIPFDLVALGLPQRLADEI